MHRYLLASLQGRFRLDNLHTAVILHYLVHAYDNQDSPRAHSSFQTFTLNRVGPDLVRTDKSGASQVCLLILIGLLVLQFKIISSSILN